MVKDMTEGKPIKLIMGFAVPMLIGNIFQQIYNLVDAAVVGRYVGDNALAAVGSTGSMLFFLVAFAGGLSGGAGIVIAQYFGSRQYDKLKKTVVALFYIIAVLTAVSMLIGNLGLDLFLELLDVPVENNVRADARSYMNIMFKFIFGMTAFNALASILRSVGDSKTPLYALSVASVINIGLDFLFVIGFDMGVRGVAYATIIAQIVSALICFVRIIRHREELYLTDIDWKPDMHMIGLIVRTGIPSAFQSCMISLGGMSVQRLVNAAGPATIAAYTASTKIDTIAIQVIVSIGMSLSVFAGQNVGIGNYDRIKTALRQTLVVMVGASVVIAIIVLFTKSYLLTIFLDPEKAGEAIAIGEVYLSIIGVAYVIAGVMQSYQNVIRGAGDVQICMVAGLAELGARILFAYLLVGPLGTLGIWLATPLSWGCGCIIPVTRYYSGKWKLKRIAEE
ncbi:MAG: MATE family efflux transporter [Lachnospiraceae bacterium]|nr:MATE family efflux transporter [Lachnospiraceae bacterium]